MDLSVAYHPIPTLELSLAMNNVFNRMPPDDHSHREHQPALQRDQLQRVWAGVYLTATYRAGR